MGAKEDEDFHLDESDYSDLNEIDGVTYDASDPPDRASWSELDEDERIILVRAYHQRIGDELPTEGQRQLHAMAHAVAETQIAAGDPREAREALDRLLAAGVPRHSAIHAIGGELMAFMHELLQQGDGLDLETYRQSLRDIDPNEWIGDTSGEGSS